MGGKYGEKTKWREGNEWPVKGGKKGRKRKKGRQKRKGGGKKEMETEM